MNLDEWWISPLEHVFWCACMCCGHVPQLLRLTAAGLSKWRSPPQQLLSMQTQTGPDQEAQRRGKPLGYDELHPKKKVRKVKLKYFTHNQIKGAGTLVRTSPGLWSLMCSSVAAMSISFTPNEDKQEKKILWWYWVYNSVWCQLMLIKLWHVLTVSHVKDWTFENVLKIFQIVCACVWLTLSHAIQYHVDEDVRASSTSPIAAENPQNIYIFLVKFT